MLILLLIDVQYLQDDGFSFDKGLICQSNSSLNSHNPINPLPPAKIPFPHLFHLFGKPWFILGSYCFYYLLALVSFTSTRCQRN